MCKGLEAWKTPTLLANGATTVRAIWGYNTFVAVDEVVFDDNAPAIEGRVHLGLASHLAEVLADLLPSGDGALQGSDAHNMASQKLVRANSLGQRGTGLGVAGAQEDGGKRDQQDVLADGDALAGKGALGEGAEEWI